MDKQRLAELERHPSVIERTQGIVVMIRDPSIPDQQIKGSVMILSQIGYIDEKTLALAAKQCGRLELAAWYGWKE